MPPSALPRDDIGRIINDILKRLERLERKAARRPIHVKPACD